MLSSTPLRSRRTLATRSAAPYVSSSRMPFGRSTKVGRPGPVVPETRGLPAAAHALALLGEAPEGVVDELVVVAAAQHARLLAVAPVLELDRQRAGARAARLQRDGGQVAIGVEGAQLDAARHRRACVRAAQQVADGVEGAHLGHAEGRHELRVPVLTVLAEAARDAAARLAAERALRPAVARDVARAVPPLDEPSRGVVAAALDRPERVVDAPPRDACADSRGPRRSGDTRKPRHFRTVPSGLVRRRLARPKRWSPRSAVCATRRAHRSTSTSSARRWRLRCARAADRARRRRSGAPHRAASSSACGRRRRRRALRTGSEPPASPAPPASRP